MRPLDGIISHPFPHLFLIHLLPAHMLTLQNHCHLGRRAMPLEKNERAIVHVVDDDASLRGALESLFDSVGLGTPSYATARDFLAASLPDEPGCIIIDIRLPDMNGLDFQAQLAQMGVQPPMVMMTGYGDISMSIRAMKHGAVDFLPKPFHDQDMIDAAMAAIERDRQRRAVDGLPGLRVRRADPDELGGGNGHGRTPKKAAAMMVDVFGQFDSLRSPGERSRELPRAAARCSRGEDIPVAWI